MNTPPFATDGPVIAASDLVRMHQRRRREPIRALDHLSIEVRRGEWVALLGPNGAGKSTLLRILATLDRADGGRAEVLGARSAAPGRRTLAAARRRLGVVFQTPALDPLLSVRENLRLHAALFGITGRAASGAIEARAAQAGVTNRLDDRVAELSGGLARRADLARALLADPDLVLLDEPTAGLDHESRLLFLGAVAALAQSGAAVVMSTHLLDEAAQASRVALMAEGRIVECGAPNDLTSALGALVLRSSAENAALLKKANLEIERFGERLLVRGGESAINAACQALWSAGATVDAGPPTLADVYLRATGAVLAESRP